MSSPETTTLFDTTAVSSAVKAMPSVKPQPPRALSSAAQDVIAEDFKRAYSPVVLAGAVRAIEVVLVATVGLVLYVGYVVPDNGFSRYYFGAIAGISLMALLAFQAADIYQVQAFRGHEKQYMRLASAWSVVFLLAVAVSFFAKAGDEFSRVWLGSYYVVGLIALLAFRRTLFLLVRRWTRQGRLDRRTVVVGADANSEVLLKSLAAQRDSDVRVIGVFDDRNDKRSLVSCNGVPNLGTVDDVVEFA